MRGIVRAGGVPKLAPLAVTAPCSSANVAAGDAGAETIVGVSGIAFAPADAGNAPNPLLTITVKVGAPFAKEGDDGPINEPGSGSTAGIRTMFSVTVPLPSQCWGKVVSARRSASAIGAFLLERDRLAESPRPVEGDADDPADADVDSDRDLSRQIGLMRYVLDRDHDRGGERQ